MSGNASLVTIVGSYNVGLLFKSQRLPGPGETIIADQFYEVAGGKGSNQAVAASMLGGQVQFVACIGHDRYGDDALAMFERQRINTRYVRRDPTTHTGMGAVLVDRSGCNLISVAPGANYHLSEEDIDAAEEAFEKSLLVGFQLENRIEVVEYAIRKVHSLNVKVLLDPAPAAKLSDDLYPCIDFIKPNEHEAKILTGIAVTDVKSAKQAGRWLVNRGVGTALITLGQLGAVCVTAHQEEHYFAQQVDAIDTTGAGDVFSGGFMAACTRGDTLDQCVRFASAAAAISVTRLGVLESIPQLSEVVGLVNN